MTLALYPARYSDGQTAAIRPVRAGLEGQRLVIRDEAGTPLDGWPTAEIRLVGTPDRDGTHRLCRAGHDSRLTVSAPDFIADLNRSCPNLRRPASPPHVRWRRIAWWSGGAVVGVLVFFFAIIPLFAREVVKLIPPALEARAGAWMSEYLIEFLADSEAKRQGKALCQAPRGEAALLRLTSALTSHAALPAPLVVQVVNSKHVNAFALPGARILLLRGLIEAAGSSNEIAGVLAHELGHVEHRHPLQIAVEQTSGAFVIGLLFGDAVGFSAAGMAVGTLLRGYYSRGMENEADERALALMRAANLSTQPLATFFDRMAKKEGDLTGLFSLLSTHPELKLRAERIRASGHVGREVLAPSDFAGLREICR